MQKSEKNVFQNTAQKSINWINKSIFGSCNIESHFYRHRERSSENMGESCIKIIQKGHNIGRPLHSEMALSITGSSIDHFDANRLGDMGSLRLQSSVIPTSLNADNISIHLLESALKITEISSWLLNVSTEGDSILMITISGHFIVVLWHSRWNLIPKPISDKIFRIINFYGAWFLFPFHPSAGVEIYQVKK